MMPCDVTVPPRRMNPETEKASCVGGPAPARLRRRLCGLLVAAPCLAMLVVGWCLDPCKSGYGTAGQVGVPACSSIVNTGWPCPSCGLTTSVSAAVQGDVRGSWRAHPFGPVLAAGAAVLAAGGLIQAATARGVLAALRFGWWWLIGALGGMLLGWGISLAVGAANGTWPVQ